MSENVEFKINDKSDAYRSAKSLLENKDIVQMIKNTSKVLQFDCRKLNASTSQVD